MLALIAVILRVGIVLWDHPHVPGGDEGLFIQIAKTIAAGGGFSFRDGGWNCLWYPGLPTASRAPGAPYWLAFWFRLVGLSLQAPRLTVAVLSGLATLPLFHVAAALRSKSAGFVCGGLWAFGLSEVAANYGVATIIAEPFALVWLILGLYSLVRMLQEGDKRWAAVLGVSVGVATLLRPTALLILVFVLFWALFYARRRKVFALLAVAAAAQFVTVAPWTIRNVVQLHTFTIVGASGGLNLYLSNNPLCTATKGTPNTAHYPIEPDVQAYISSVRDVDADRYCSARAFAYLRANPRVIPYLVFRRMLLLFDPTTDLLGGRAVFDGFYALMLLLTGVTFVRYRRSPWLWLIACWALTFLWVHLLYQSHPRYRQMIDPALMVCAGVGASELLRCPRGRLLLTLGVLMAVLLTGFSAPVFHLIRQIV